MDNLIVLSYLLLTLFIGICNRSRSGNFKSFASVKDSTRNNKLLLMATIFVSSVGGGTTFGLAEKSFTGNIAFTYGLILTIPIDLLVARFVVPQLTKHYGAESIGDIMVAYYGRAGRMIAGISAIVLSIGFLAAQISVSGRIFQYILRVDFIQGVILSYSIVIIYTTIGGLRSVMFTNVLQFFAMIVAIPVITIIGIKIIGLDNFIASVPKDRIFFSHDNSLFTDTLSATLSFAVMGLYPNFIQRTLINSNHKETSKAIYYKTAIYSVFLVFTTINGLIAYLIYPEQASSLALPFLIDQIIPVGLKGIVVVGLLATVMSTADSDLNITSISLVKDLFVPIYGEKNQQKLLQLARVANIIVGSAAIFIALRYTSIVDLVVFVAGFWGPIIVVPLLFGLFGTTIPKKMMILNSVISPAIFLIWEHYFANMYNLRGVFVGT
ncbi:MAG: sodium:solute symporter family protein, partial [Janthinobacterium lividum]